MPSTAPSGTMIATPTGPQLTPAQLKGRSRADHLDLHQQFSQPVPVPLIVPGGSQPDHRRTAAEALPAMDRCADLGTAPSRDHRHTAPAGSARQTNRGPASNEGGRDRPDADQGRAGPEIAARLQARVEQRRPGGQGAVRHRRQRRNRVRRARPAFQ